MSDKRAPKERLKDACKVAGMSYGVWAKDEREQELMQLTNTKRIALSIVAALPEMGLINRHETWGF